MRASQRFCRLEKILALKLGSQRRSIGAEHRHFEPFADARSVPLDRQRGDAEPLAVGIGVVDEAAGTQHMRIIEQILGTIIGEKQMLSRSSVSESSAAFRRFITSA